MGGGEKRGEREGRWWGVKEYRTNQMQMLVLVLGSAVLVLASEE